MVLIICRSRIQLIVFFILIIRPSIKMIHLIILLKNDSYTCKNYYNIFDSLCDSNGYQNLESIYQHKGSWYSFFNTIIDMTLIYTLIAYFIITYMYSREARRRLKTILDVWNHLLIYWMQKLFGSLNYRGIKNQYTFLSLLTFIWVGHMVNFGPVVSNHGSLRAVPAPVARGCHGPQDHRYMPI